MKKFILACLLASAHLYAATTPLTVMLDASPNPDHAPLVIAVEKGFFKAQGLNVTLISSLNPETAAAAIAHKNADIGLTHEPALIEQIDQGLPLKTIGILIDKPLTCLTVIKTNGIQSIVDLKGKRVTAGDELSMAMLKTILTKKGLSTQDVDFINLNYKEPLQALQNHNVDAASGLSRTSDFSALNKNGQKVFAFFPEENGIPNYSELVFVTHSDNTKDPRLPRFLAAVRQAVYYLDEHPEEGWRIFSNRYPTENTPKNKQIWFTTLPYFAEEPTQIHPHEWLKFAKFMQENHLIKTVQPMSRYAISFTLPPM